ncbi:MAG: hypothetical protein KC501_25090 [Myxococcales bacterium]|nr:hypothetical protein [Myxococcales bacterium]
MKDIRRVRPAEEDRPSLQAKLEASRAALAALEAILDARPAEGVALEEIETLEHLRSTVRRLDLELEVLGAELLQEFERLLDPECDALEQTLRELRPQEDTALLERVHARLFGPGGST